MLVCDLCQNPICTEYYVVERHPAPNSIGHTNTYYHLQCFIRKMEEMKV